MSPQFRQFEAVALLLRGDQAPVVHKAGGIGIVTEISAALEIVLQRRCVDRFALHVDFAIEAGRERRAWVPSLRFTVGR